MQGRCLIWNVRRQPAPRRLVKLLENPSRSKYLFDGAQDCKCLTAIGVDVSVHGWFDLQKILLPILAMGPCGLARLTRRVVGLKFPDKKGSCAGGATSFSQLNLLEQGGLIDDQISYCVKDGCATYLLGCAHRSVAVDRYRISIICIWDDSTQSYIQRESFRLF
jgi:hypothetical protein